MNPFGEEQETGENLERNHEATERVLRQTIAEEEAHYRAKGQWDDVENKPKRVQVTNPLWKGDDWTHEERQSLRVAQTAMGLGSLYIVGVTLAGIFRSIGAQEGVAAAEARSAAEEASTGNVSAVNQALEDSAVHSYWGQVTDVTNTGITALGALASGCYQFWIVWTKHKENVDNLNDPDISKKRAALQERLTRLETKLREELRQLRENEELHHRKDKKKKVIVQRSPRRAVRGEQRRTAPAASGCGPSATARGIRTGTCRDPDGPHARSCPSPSATGKTACSASGPADRGPCRPPRRPRPQSSGRPAADPSRGWGPRRPAREATHRHR